MAGIGFELRRLLRRQSYTGLLQAYLFAGILGAGPWVISILAMLLVHVVGLTRLVTPVAVSQFQVTVTWLIAFSLILSGGIQLYYTRYVADRLFEHRPDTILPAFHSAALSALAVAFPAVLVFLLLTAETLSVLYQLLAIACFSLLNLVWLLTMLLTGLKRYRLILLTYLLGYGTMLLACRYLHPSGIEDLLAGFLLAQLILVLGMGALVWREYPSRRLISADLWRPGRGFPSLLLTGVLLNLGVWIDKIIFWLGPTGTPVLDALRASPVYDTPIFLAYLAIVPGMAVFILRVETDFAEAYESYYRTVLGGGTLSSILNLQREMILSARDSIFDIVKIQSLTAMLIISAGPRLLELFGLDPLYTPLFQIDVVGVGVQVVLIGAVNILFYLDKRCKVLAVSLLLVAANAGLTLLSLALGPEFYGYGFALAMLAASAAALFFIDRELRDLTYKTFMMYTGH